MVLNNVILSTPIVCIVLVIINISLYMFLMSPHLSSGVLKTVTAASGTGHDTGTATSLQRGLIRPSNVALSGHVGGK